MGKESGDLSIGELAAASGVAVETIRYYQREGLVAEPPRPPGGIRRYGEADVARLKFIKSAQRLGFALNGVAELLRLDDGGGCSAVRARAQTKLDEVRERLADLQRMESALAELVDRCAVSRGTVRCPLIASLQAA
jgi:MerR family transcriptional regulator, mercuric resistance operon regulatory protein